VAGVIHIQWYATLGRKESLTAEVMLAAPLALRYGATAYSVHNSRDDRYRLLQMAWFERVADWHRYWDGPEMVEFRRRNSGRYQIPIAYVWHDELVAGALGPEVGIPEAEPAPVPEPQAAV
jgi:hypothetical protein